MNYFRCCDMITINQSVTKLSTFVNMDVVWWYIIFKLLCYALTLNLRPSSMIIIINVYFKMLIMQYQPSLFRGRRTCVDIFAAVVQHLY